MPTADRTAVTDADFYLLEQSLEPEARARLRLAPSEVGGAPEANSYV